MRRMNWRNVLIPVAALLLMMWAYHAFGWSGIVFVISGGVLWILLNFTRMVTILKRAGQRPVGYADSAVMLNAKLKPGQMLAIPLTEGEQPMCAFFIKDISRQSEVVDYGKIW